MKKNIKKFLLTFITIFLCTNLFTANTYSDIDEKTIVKDTITKYFDKKLSSLLNNYDENYDDISKNDDFKAYTILNNKYIKDINLGINRKLTNYSYSISYDNWEFSNKCNVYLTLNIIYEYEENNEIINVNMEESHIIVLNKYDNKWFIDKDIYDSLACPDKEYINNDNYNKLLLDGLTEEYKNINLKINSLNSEPILLDDNEIKLNSAQPKSAYHPDVAINYAKEWAYGRNPQFYDYDKDCTNFVSQCINWGGIGRNDKFNYIGPTNSWIQVEALHDYLISSKLALSREFTVASVGSMGYYSRKGDVVQLYNILKGRYSHSVIINRKSTINDDVYYASHSEDRFDQNLREALITEWQYSKLRLIQFFY